MNKLLLFFLMWFSACAVAIPPYDNVSPAAFYVAQETNVYVGPGRSAAGVLAGGTACTVVGQHDTWFIIQGSGGSRYWVPQKALNYGAPAADFGMPIPATPTGVTHDTYTGPRGGQYYYNGNGNKTYVTPQSTIDREYIQTGPRGGQYYINRNGNKTYIKH